MGQVRDTAWVEFSTEAQIDDSPILRNILLCGNHSQNGYEIPPAAFGQESRARELYEDRLVLFNHGHPSERSVDDLGGIIKNVRMVGGKPYGDIDTEGMPKGVALKALVQKKPPGIGMSHTAAYEMSKDRKKVLSVKEVFSVDVVVRPATTSTFHERTQGNSMENEVLQNELQAVRTERDEAKNKITTLSVTVETQANTISDYESQIEILKSEKAALVQEKEELSDKLDAHEARIAAEQRRTDVFNAIREAGLDPEDKAICSDRFVESLVKESDETARKELIAERKELVGQAPGTPRSSERRQKSPAPPSEFNAKSHIEALGSKIFSR